MSKELFIYSETAFHHEGDFEYLMGLIEATKDSGANGIKFQVIVELDYLTSTKHSSYETLLNYTFSAEQWLKAINYASSIGLETIFMPLDPGSFNLIDQLNQKPKYVEIHPVCFKDEDIIAGIKQTKLPVILGVGGRSLEEIDASINDLSGQLEVLMVGFQSFPSKLRDVKLARISKLKEKYPTLKIGYADHSGYDNEFAVVSNEYALLMGAEIFEKHLSLNQGVERVDFQSAIDKEKLKQVIERLQFINTAILNITEDQLFSIEEPELSYRNREKVMVAAMDLEKGEEITLDKIKMRMIDKEGGFNSSTELLGKKLTRNIVKDDLITKDHIL